MTSNADRLNYRLRRVTQAIADFSGKPWSQLKILDLGSLEGHYAIEFASRGATVTAIEGRESNNLKARAAAISRGLADRVQFVTDDVRNTKAYGQFDVVLCSGILYHLPGEDACRLLETIAEVSTLAIIDTHIGLRDLETVTWKGKQYFGVSYREHAATDTAEQKAERAWSSLDNETSFWITRPSLLNLLHAVGFTTVAEVVRPMSFLDFSDRITFAAIKGAPQVEREAEPDYPEHSSLHPHSGQAQYIVREVSRTPSWRRMLRRIVGRRQSY